MADAAARAQQHAAEEVAEAARRERRRAEEAGQAFSRAEALAQQITLERDAVLREAAVAQTAATRAEAWQLHAAREMQDAASLRARSESQVLDANSRAQAHEASVAAHSKAEVAMAESRAVDLEASAARDARARMENELRRREFEASNPHL